MENPNVALLLAVSDIAEVLLLHWGLTVLLDRHLLKLLLHVHWWRNARGKVGVNSLHLRVSWHAHSHLLLRLLSTVVRLSLVHGILVIHLGLVVHLGLRRVVIVMLNNGGFNDSLLNLFLF